MIHYINLHVSPYRLINSINLETEAFFTAH